MPQEDFTAVQPELIDLQPKPIAYVSREANSAQADGVIAEALGRIRPFLVESGRQQVDTPIVVTRSLDTQTRDWKFDVGVPIDQACTAPSEAEDLRCGNTYGGWAVRAHRAAAPTSVERSYFLLKTYLLVAGLEDNGPSWQQIETPADAGSTSPLQLFSPVK